ncbi:hypothetical protein H311_03152 [Anncaliia algerae PRA109]|nr:hypothetical protein H311_03152 [Anncaliia algerae PRA109]
MKIHANKTWRDSVAIQIDKIYIRHSKKPTFLFTLKFDFPRIIWLLGMSEMIIERIKLIILPNRLQTTFPSIFKEHLHEGFVINTDRNRSYPPAARVITECTE